MNNDWTPINQSNCLNIIITYPALFPLISEHNEVWDGETKVHGVDDIFEQNVSSNLQRHSSPLSKSLPVPSSPRKGKHENLTF